jgi:hypothetical protein
VETVQSSISLDKSVDIPETPKTRNDVVHAASWTTCDFRFYRGETGSEAFRKGGWGLPGKTGGVFEKF